MTPIPSDLRTLRLAPADTRTAASLPFRRSQPREVLTDHLTTQAAESQPTALGSLASASRWAHPPPGAGRLLPAGTWPGGLAPPGPCEMVLVTIFQQPHKDEVTRSAHLPTADSPGSREGDAVSLLPSCAGCKATSGFFLLNKKTESQVLWRNLRAPRSPVWPGPQPLLTCRSTPSADFLSSTPRQPVSVKRTRK